MERIKVKLLRTEEPGFFHDSRRDARIMARAVNLLIDKVNELIKENNKLRAMIEAKAAKPGECNCGAQIPEGDPFDGYCTDCG